ncbi:MAG TPA: hypothetical protein PLN96_04030 [Zoogloea sp.]|uniref:glycine zipper domain-containing protein n=1 Tax=Zoogloea sp. TaxID=49181 RepID=UPI002C0EAC10|nr:hypothetical protein [Zoogloea sp.]HMV19056.1 hypothetical protein [Rhodocyclaceae bacterium]HMW52022.1 hypothetical protein [Rhodocyclaceae bacterium]HMY50798.1 hypothetical protein [Rhodocyclaceae bacterium]HMZ76716.1 hypothetical protein [Rhodocyclaceae bacterium]HNA66712.1 hypothetical protein [Rhodocyclaceae bacterium]
MSATHSTANSLRQIANDLGDSARDALPPVRKQLGITADTTREAATSLMGNLRTAARDTVGIVRRDAAHASEAAGAYIRRKPLQSAAVVGVVGLLIGALLGRRF